MEKDNKFWKGALTGALVTAFAGLLIVGLSAGIFIFGSGMIRRKEQAKGPGYELEQNGEAGGGAAASGNGEENEEKKDSLDYTQVAVKLQVMQELIDKYFLFDEDLEEVEDTIYLGMIVGLGDMYSTYYSPKDLQDLREEVEGEYYGIGALISQNLYTGVVTVTKVYRGTPAEEAGLMAGDRIYTVSGEAATGVDLDVLVSTKIRGEEGTPVEMEVYRPSEERYVKLSITRGKVEVPTVESEMLENQVGYVAVSQFDVVTVEQFESAVEELKAQGMEKLVIDLRNNGGGVMESAVSMLDYLLPDDITTWEDPYGVEENQGHTLLVYTADKNEEGKSQCAFDGKELDLPMAILVNENSASASEIFAGAMKDYEKAVLVGTTTYGKGIVQTIFPLADGSAVKLTTENYYTPSGKSLHGVGIEPDVWVEPNETLQERLEVEPEEDNQLQAALDVFEKGAEAVKEELGSDSARRESTEAFPGKEVIEETEEETEPAEEEPQE